MSRFFISTTADKARALAERRADLFNDYDDLVVLTERPVDSREGVRGDIICAVELRAGTSISRYEKPGARRFDREWHLPVAVFLRLMKAIHLI